MRYREEVDYEGEPKRSPVGGGNSKHHKSRHDTVYHDYTEYST